MKKALLLLAPVLLTACSQKEEDMATSTRMYDSLKETTNSSSLTRVADSMRNTGNYGTAIKSYQQAIQVDPTQWNAHIGLSYCLRQTGRAEAAQEVLLKVPADERDITWYKELAGVYTVAHKPKKCIEAYTQALNLDPVNIGAYNGIGVCHDMMGQHAEAQKWYRTAIEKSPSDPRLKSNLGLSLALSNKTEEALDLLKNIVDSPDATPRDRQNLAIAYGVSGDIETAAKLFAQDLDQQAVRMNLAFVHKLAKTQPLAPTQAASEQTSSEGFQTNLAAPVDTKQNQTEQAPAEPAQQSAAGTFGGEITRDTHVMVSALPPEENHKLESPSQNTPIKPLDKAHDETQESFTADDLKDTDSKAVEADEVFDEAQEVKDTPKTKKKEVKKSRKTSASKDKPAKKKVAKKKSEPVKSKASSTKKA